MGTFLFFAMKKDILDIVEEISHQLRSPLASIKSYIYLTNHSIKKNDAKKTAEYLSLLEQKTDLLTMRIDLIVTALLLKTEKESLAYELFNLSEIDKAAKNIEVLGDRSMLTRMIDYAKELTGSSPTFNADHEFVTIMFPLTNRPHPTDKDEKTDLMEKEIIVHATAAVHDGHTDQRNDKLIIVLPLKPKKRR